MLQHDIRSHVYIHAPKVRERNNSNGISLLLKWTLFWYHAYVPLRATISTVHRLLMRDGTIQSGKTLKWIKVIAVSKPASEAQINLSSAGRWGVVGHSNQMV